MDRIQRILLWAAISAVGTVFGCATERGMDPHPVLYNIYIAATDYRQLPLTSHVFVYDADSLKLLDSIPVQSDGFDMAVSPDGQSLFLQMDSGEPLAEGQLVSVRTATHEVEWSVPGNGPEVTMLSGGRWIINGNDLLDASNGSVVRRLPDTLRIGRGPITGTEVAAMPTVTLGVYSFDTVVTILDVETGETHGRFVTPVTVGGALRVYSAWLHPDKTRVLVIGARGALSNTWFVVGDTQTGETLLTHRLTYPYGEVAFSSDGSLVVVTDPSQPLVRDSQATVDIFDLRSMVHLKRLIFPDDIYRIAEVEFLPCDCGVVGSGSNGPLHIIDMATLSVQDTTWLPFAQIWKGALGLGPRPD